MSFHAVPDYYWSNLTWIGIETVPASFVAKLSLFIRPTGRILSLWFLTHKLLRFAGLLLQKSYFNAIAPQCGDNGVFKIEH